MQAYYVSAWVALLQQQRLVKTSSPGLVRPMLGSNQAACTPPSPDDRAEDSASAVGGGDVGLSSTRSFFGIARPLEVQPSGFGWIDGVFMVFFLIVCTLTWARLL